MIVGCIKEAVEHSVPHIPFVNGEDWVSVSLSNPCPLKIADKSVEFRGRRKLLRNFIPGNKDILYRNKG